MIFFKVRIDKILFKIDYLANSFSELVILSIKKKMLAKP